MARDDSDKYFGSLLVPGGICLALALTQQHIENWKATSAHIKEAFVIAPDSAGVNQPVPLAFITGALTAPASVREPLADVSIPGAVAVKVLRERYERGSGRRSSYSWRDKETLTATVGTAGLANFNLDPQLLRNNAGEMWQRYDASHLQGTPLITHNNGWHAYNGYLYAQPSHSNSVGNIRYRYSIVPITDTATAVAMAQPQGSNPSYLTATPAMPAGYPALWYGEVTPESFKATLYKRFLNTMAGIGGVLFLLGWVGMIMLNILFDTRKKVAGAICGLGAAAASISSLVVWYLIPSWFIAAPLSILFVIGFYMALRATQPERTFPRD